MLNLGDFVNYYGYSEPFGVRPGVVWEIFSCETPQGENGPMTVSLRNIDDHNDTVRVKDANSHLHLFKVVGSRDKSGNPLWVGDVVIFTEKTVPGQGVVSGWNLDGSLLVETPYRTFQFETGRDVCKIKPEPIFSVGDLVKLVNASNAGTWRVISIKTTGSLNLCRIGPQSPNTLYGVVPSSVTWVGHESFPPEDVMRLLPVDRDGNPLYVGDSVTFFTGQNPEIGEVGKIISIDSPGEMKIQTASGTYVGSLSGSIQKIKQEQSSGTKREEPRFNLGDLVTIRKEVPYCDPTQTFIIQGVFRDSYKIQSVSRHGFSVTLSGVKANELCEVVPTPQFPHQTVLKRTQPGTVFYFYTKDRDGTYTPDKRFRYLLLESASTNKSRYVLQPPHLTNHVLIYDLTRKSLHFRDRDSKVYVEEPSL